VLWSSSRAKIQKNVLRATGSKNRLFFNSFFVLTQPTNFPLNLGIGYLNDLWKYSVSDSTWTWVSGSTESRRSGDPVDANSENVPNPRRYAVGWLDESTNELWLFGGHGLFNTGLGALWTIQSLKINK